MAMNKKIIAGVVIIVLAVAVGGYKYLRPGETGITATGTVEVTRADVMPKVSGYLTGLKVKVGDTVQARQKVAEITRNDLEAQVIRDEAVLAKASAQLRDLEAGSRSQELQELQAALDSAQSVYEKAKQDYQRYQNLYAAGAISAQQLDAARSSLEVAYSSMAAANQRLSLGNEGNRPEVIEAQRQELERSKAVLAASKVLLADTEVISPISGLILSKNFEDGEYVNPGAAILTVGDMSDCWVKIYISSAQLGLISVGQEAKVKVDSFPDRIFRGEIKEINQNAEFTPRQSITQSERANLVFAVKVKLDNSEGILKPGMPADVVLK
ncbi:HlyD family secretion protein [Sporomusa acidovorans]|uniref:Multidrug export protein EmrA n=1 Tax=Sporomusa acidovorans (strain ATCC 49682 / DSM 3132 / Mol) TaxID=1123286 RepID=A0ABZ3J5S9_SPOA4|nr:efflux RND transporter periplasmic adaptor subunit [Sporomusa acidovorans]OZC16392.1 macrolide export protein MacA [Sporomusa acidovorans DSM 3132]SDF00158.1 HlyD family secretion protein [Sporomusa acidovorans]